MIAAQWEQPRAAPAAGIYPVASLTPRRAVRIALVGPDGVGKSTAIAALQQFFHDELPGMSFAVRQWRPGLFPDLGVYLGKSTAPVQKMPPRRKAGRFRGVRVFYYFLDFLIGAWWKDRVRLPAASLIVYDRCALDMFVDPVRFGLSSSYGTRLLWKLTPRPDLIVLLHDDPERIWQRKRELARHEMAEQLATWLQLAEGGDVDAVIQVDCGAEEVAARLLNLTLDLLVRKSGLEPPRQSGEEPLARLIAGPPDAVPYAVLPSAGTPRFLVPLAGQGAAARSLDMYSPQTKRARAGKRLLQAGLRTGLAQPFLRNRRYLGTGLRDYLREALRQPGLTFAVSAGTPNRSQKPVLQLMDGGRIAGYAKIGWNDRTIALVRNEAATLASMRDVRFQTADIPQVLHAGSWRGCYVLVQSSPPGKLQSCATSLDERHLRFLTDLHSLDSSLQSMPWGRPRAETAMQLEALRERGFAYYSHLLETAVATCERRAGGAPMPCGFGHGDFAPWNIRLSERGLLVIDWEYGSTACPALWDLFHFHLSTAIELRQCGAPELCRELLQPGSVHSQIGRYCAAAGVAESLIQPLLIGYLCEALHNNLVLHEAVPAAKDQRGRAILAGLLTILARPGSPTMDRPA